MSSLAKQFARHVLGFIKRRRWIFAFLGAALIFFAGTWWGRSVQVRRITAYIKSYADVSRRDVTVQIAPGIMHRQIKRGVLINILTVSPDAAVIRPYRALDAGLGVESVVSTARRRGALAAVNGGYFEMSGTFRGESVGALKIDGEWVSEPEQNRAAIGLSNANGRIHAVIDRIALKIELVPPSGESIEIDGINRGRLQNELILYRPIFHPVTLTDPDGAEVVVRNNRVVEIHGGQGGSRIPPDGYALSATGARRDWLISRLSVGDEVSIRETVIPERTETQEAWRKAEHVLGGGPLLLRGGTPAVSKTLETEGFKREFYGWQHPRTAVGVKADGTLILATITAAAPNVRRGVTLIRLAELMREWGAWDALNLDGGESTIMVIDGKVVNTLAPSKSKTKTAKGNQRTRPAPVEVGRPVADGLLIFGVVDKK
jgi:exopolysaccharide biosynthesis protein